MNNQHPESVTTTCSYCGVGCGIVVNKDKKGNITVEGDKNHPVNKGMLCSKGMNIHYTVNDKSDRLFYPQMRYNKNMPLQRVSWDAALDRTAAVFKTFIDKYGKDSVAFYVSGQCLTEEYYVINKLIKGFIGSNNIDTNSRLCMSSAVVGYKMTLGEDSVPVCYDDIELADCFYVTGANPAWCHPIIWRRVEAHKEGFERYKDLVFERSIAEAAQICGVSEDDIRLAAQYIGNAKGFLTMWTMGLNQSSIGVNKNLSLINLNLITGHIGKPGSGPFSLTGQPNAMGGREVGGMATMLSAHRNLASETDRAFMQQFWGGTAINPKPGYTATEMFEALNDGRLKAIWIMGSNPLVSLPDVRKAEEGLRKAKFVVVQEVSNKPETIQYADVVLPAAAWAEKEGTMTNAERRITYLHKIVDAPGEALPDAEIICRFAKAMDYHGFDYTNFSEIYDEHCRSTSGTNIDISGLSYEVLKENRSIQYPYKEDKKETPRLFTDKQFYTPSGKAIIHAVDDENESEPTTA